MFPTRLAVEDKNLEPSANRLDLDLESRNRSGSDKERYATLIILPSRLFAIAAVEGRWYTGAYLSSGAERSMSITLNARYPPHHNHGVDVVDVVREQPLVSRQSPLRIVGESATQQRTRVNT